MRSTRSRHTAIALIALLLQLHGVIAFAFPCVACGPGEPAVKAASQTIGQSDTDALPPCHQPEIANSIAAADVDEPDSYCPHCASGDCVGNSVMALPTDQAAVNQRRSSAFFTPLGQSLVYSDISPPFRPPIV